MKGNNFYECYQQGTALLKGQCLGYYVFLWCQKQERTSTWFDMFLSTEEVIVCVAAMHILWNDASPKIASAILETIHLDAKSALDNIRHKSAMEYNAIAEVSVNDREVLKYL